MKKFLMVLGLVLLSSGVVYGDGGVSFSYKKTPIKYGSKVSYVDFLTINVYADDWLKSRNKAGYIFGWNVSYAPKSKTFEMFTTDFYIGKRLFVIPKLAHVYFKVGPSVATIFYSPQVKSQNYDVRLGVIGSLGLQAQVLKGIKLFSEYEFRKYSEVATIGSGVNPNISIVNTLPSKTDFIDGETRKSFLKQLKFGMKFSF